VYKTRPITISQNELPGKPPGTLINGADSKQVLGVFTPAGDIVLDTNGDTLEVDAALASLRAGGSGGLVNNGNRIDTLTVVGARIQNQIKNINATTRNILFDQRFGTGFAPPWFPSTIINLVGQETTTVETPSFQRTK